MINILIIEDDVYLRESIINDFSKDKSINIQSVYCSIEELMNDQDVINLTPDIILLDLVLPGMSGIDGINILKKFWSKVDILMISVMEDYNSVFKALCEGAVGYVTKDVQNDQILQMIHDIHEGKGAMSASIARKVAEAFHKKINNKEKLTAREKDIIAGILDGLSYKLIADKYHISIDTVKKHIKSIYVKLQINSKSQLMKLYTLFR